MNYIQGWYEGDAAARMESAPHPDCDPKAGHNQFNHMGWSKGRRRGGRSKTPKDQELRESTILDRFNAAVVRRR